jgi:hypothetical protein
MSFDDLKAHLDRLFAYRPTGSSREQAAGLRAALVEFKVAVEQLREGLVRTEGDLDRARRELVDYERRRGLAAEIDDAETVRVADEYILRTRERVDLLERKVIVQRDEVVIAERELEATRARYQRASHGLPLDEPRGDDPASLDATLGDPEPYLDRQTRDAVVNAQLEALKKKLGRE